MPQIIRQKKGKGFFVHAAVEKFVAYKSVEIVKNLSSLPAANDGRRRGRFRIRPKGRNSVFLSFS